VVRQRCADQCSCVQRLFRLGEHFSPRSCRSQQDPPTQELGCRQSHLSSWEPHPVGAACSELQDRAPSARPAQFFDAAFRKQYPHAARWLATVYSQPAWLAAVTAPTEPPAKAFTFADAVAGRTFERDGGQHAAAHVERYRPTAWSGALCRRVC